MGKSQAKAVCINGNWYVVYAATGKMERCHNRQTAQFIEQNANRQEPKEKSHGVLA